MAKKILIVDDDAGLADEMADILRDSGYCVESAFDSILGFKLIHENIYDIYLLDYKMTGLNGVDLLKKARERNNNSTVIIISGKPSIELLLQEERVDDLVDGVIKKPFTAEVLLGTIQSLA
jgi:DNA-binding response OmpR family regulator